VSKFINIIFAGDVVGEPGRRAIRELLPKLREEHQAEFCVVNGENSAGGAGITPKIFSELREAGADVVTTGDHVWDNKEILSIVGGETRLLRPANYPVRAAGFGSVVVESPAGIKFGVLNLMGRTFMKDLDCPFHVAERELENLRKQTSIILVDMHAETTSEKIAIGRFLDGKVSAVIGTHTHVQTADEQVFPGGTAFLCDAGMTGPHESILGREIEPIIKKFITQMPQRFEVAKKGIQLNGAVIKVNAETGLALNIKRLSVPLEG
jgi:2',3'-cyclic-nucleotide 2'-phosphodiesterase